MPHLNTDDLILSLHDDCCAVENVQQTILLMPVKWLSPSENVNIPRPFYPTG